MQPELLNPEIQNLIKEHRNSDISLVALKLSNRKDINTKAVLEQINGFQKSRKKLPSWHKKEGIVFPSIVSMEQCSSEQTARFKSSLFSGETFIDLTSGLGVDSAFFSEKFKKVILVEPQPDLLEVTKHNFNILGIQNARYFNLKAEEFISETDIRADLVYIDPSRRNEGKRKVFHLKDYTPDIIKLKESIFQISPDILVKTSPFLDIHLAIEVLENVSHVYAVSVNNECKEVLYHLKNGFTLEPKLTAIDIREKDIVKFEFYRHEEETAIPEFSMPLTYLYEPNASIMKAGAFKLIAQSYKLNKLHPLSHLYTSKIQIKDFPGRTFKTTSVFKKVKELKESNIKKANISLRNYRGSIEEFRKITGIKEGGDIYVFATTAMDGKPVIIATEKV
jgi:hypothetical protein